MSAEDWRETRRLRGKKVAVPMQEKPKKQYYIRCQDCGRLIPLETQGLLCGECQERRSGVIVDNPMELALRSLGRR